MLHLRPQTDFEIFTLDRHFALQGMLLQCSILMVLGDLPISCNGFKLHSLLGTPLTYIDAKISFDSEMPLVALLGLMHLGPRSPVLIFVEEASL